LKKRFSDYQTENLRIIPISRVFVTTEFSRQVNRDTIYVVGSIIFVFCYITLHVKSVALSIPAIVMVVLSFPLTVFIYYYVVRIPMFNAMHTLTLFIVLGIAADNIFVFFDAW